MLPIITSLMDQDLYKFSMQQAVLHNCPDAWVKIVFKNRSDVDIRYLIPRIKEEVHELCKLRFTEPELQYLSTIRFFKRDYIQFLRLFQLNENFIYIGEKDGKLHIVAEGPWLHVIFFEIFVLEIVQELYFQSLGDKVDYYKARERLTNKIVLLDEYREKKGKIPTIIDFGARRRASYNWHRYVVKQLVNNKIIIGTSDVKLAMDYGIKAIGTFAHEWVQAFQGLGVCQLVDSQKMAFDTWAREYRGDLGIALSDTLGTAKFLKDFDMFFAKLFDGCRHDSGDPFEWGDMLIKHYESFNIDPRTKSLVFSDGLDIPTALKLFEYFDGRIKTSFGIGTNLTNDLNIPALQLVMKMVECNGNPVAKVSNNLGKTMCENDGFLKYLLYVVGR